LASDRLPIIGNWFPARSGQGMTARLYCDPTGSCRVFDETGVLLRDGEKGDYDISPRVGDIARVITFSDQSTFITNDNPAIDFALSHMGHKYHGFVHYCEQFKSRLLIMLVAIIVLSRLIYVYALPILIEVAVLLTPKIATDAMSHSTLATLDRIVFEQSELKKQHQNDILTDFHALTAASQFKNYTFKLQFRKGGNLGANAFALPDGSIVITDELIKLVGTDKDAIMGVLAHEIGHVEKQHSLKLLYRAAGMAGLAMLISGDLGSASGDVLINTSALLSLSYSRGAETEADQHSVDLMRKVERDPLALARFFAKIETITGGEDEISVFSTHPATPQRVQDIDTYIRTKK
jgi:Zn-dependent protease with chaperone function